MSERPPRDERYRRDRKDRPEHSDHRYRRDPRERDSNRSRERDRDRDFDFERELRAYERDRDFERERDGSEKRRRHEEPSREMEARGRGRGYGRARAQTAGSSQQQPQQRPGSSQQSGEPRGPPPQGAWGMRPPQSTSSPWPRPQMGGPPPQQSQPQIALGRGERASEGAIPRRIVGEGSGSASEEGGSSRGAISVRGRVINRREILFTRPDTASTKKGKTGDPINLIANYLPLIKPGKWCLYQYRVDFAPDIDHTGKRKALVRGATKELFTLGFLFDGTVLYTTQRINNDAAELFVKDEEENVKINIRLVGDLAWGDGAYIQIFNIMIRKCLSLMGLKQVGRNYFLPDNRIMVTEHRLQLWPGYFTSMRQHEKDILLNVDLQFKIMRTDNVFDLLLECRGQNARRDFQAQIIGCVVLTYYNNKTYKIDDVDFNTTPKHTFKMADGSEITYKDYYKKRYGVKISADDQPMLISRTKKRELKAGMPETIYLVPELCQMTGLTDRQRENFHLMKALSNHTRLGVEARIKKLEEFSRKLHNKPDVVNEIRRWDLGIGDSLVRFQGRVLRNETIFGGESEKYPSGHQADWTRDVRARPMLHAPRMERLTVVVPGRLKNQAQDFIQALKKCAGGMKWSIGNPQFFDLPDDRTGTYIENIDRLINVNQPTLILVVLTNNSAERYSAIKKKCLVDRGIPTQMIVARNLSSKGVMSIATKVAIQMNCKIGGAPWSVMVPLKNLMVVGYDVCRDTANKKKSFAGMVASLDKQLSRYFSFTSEHKMEEELSNNFSAFLVMACKRYKDHNGNFPERIVIYRDGVGAGQLPYVYNFEVENIENKLKQEIYKEQELKMAFIVVTKRINTRIFTERDNPPPGTIVDDVITLPQSYDFFLVSQCVRQGTVSPTNFNILKDTVGLPPDHIQMLTYKLTHMYYNWSGTVRVPAPCQYAHKFAFMVSQYLHRPAHKDLADLLFYL